MFSKLLPFSLLAKQGRWKVEFFAAHGKEIRPTAFPLVRLKDILIERRGFLDPQQYPDHLFNYLGLEHVQSTTGDLVENFTPREGRTVLSRSNGFGDGDLL
jgi:hypothetical protein